MKTVRVFLISKIIFLIAFAAVSQEVSQGYIITDKHDLKATSVKNQNSTGTCWSFATTSFIESELMRMGKPEYDISEMFFVRYAYIQKGMDYVRYQGKTNFGEGGQAHDVLNVIKKYGFSDQKYYEGNTYDPGNYNHGELEAMLKAVLDVVLSKPNKKLTPVWDEAYVAIIDTYLGELPESVKEKKVSHSTIGFATETGFNPNDYVEITSFTHHPFYEQFILEVPDNWSKELYYNVPLDDLMLIMNNSLKMGYSFVWDGDMSQPGFSHKNGFAIVPEGEVQFEKPAPEKNITQQYRQQEFDNLSTFDDHLMHITGLANDQNGTTYYKTKNSWGTERGKFGGYLYMSEQYMRLNTIAILVHKNTIPKEIKEKLKIN
ncbi:MAG: C1 family peptidase [Bacteroidales bacterium]